MKITVSSDLDHVIQLDVDSEQQVEDVKALIEVETGIPILSQQLQFNGAPLANNVTLGAAGVCEDDLLLVTTVDRSIASSIGRIAPPNQTHLAREGMTVADIPSNCSPELLLSIGQKNPNIIVQLESSNPELGAALRSGDIVAVRMQMIKFHMQLAAKKYEEEQELIRLNQNPFDLDAQAKIEENIRLGNVQQNMENAIDHMPEAFGSVKMLYIYCVVNGVPVKAFVDSGAQSTIMTSVCAERCGIMRLVDRRFAGTAVGVGTATIVGRVHMAPLKIGDYFYNCSFTILEQKGVEFLLGLDMLKRHQCCIDLKRGVLTLEGASGSHDVSFLPDHEIPDKDGHELPLTDQKPTVDGLSASPAPAPATAGVPTSGGVLPIGSEVAVDEAAVEQLVGMGFPRETVLQALRSCGGNIELAAGLLFESHSH